MTPPRSYPILSMLEWSMGNLRIRLQLPFVASLLLMMLADGEGIPLWCLAASLMHETGHIVAVLALQERPVRVELGLFGMRMLPGDESLCYSRQMAVLLAGPAVNLFTAGVLFLAGNRGVVMLIHLVIGVFNLLPIEPLDGGQALLCGLSMRGDMARAEKSVFALSLVGCSALLLTGFALLFWGGYNYTLLAVAIYLLILIVLNHKA